MSLVPEVVGLHYGNSEITKDPQASFGSSTEKKDCSFWAGSSRQSGCFSNQMRASSSVWKPKRDREQPNEGWSVHSSPVQ